MILSIAVWSKTFAVLVGASDGSTDETLVSEASMRIGSSEQAAPAGPPALTVVLKGRDWHSGQLPPCMVGWVSLPLGMSRGKISYLVMWIWGTAVSFLSLWWNIPKSQSRLEESLPSRWQILVTGVSNRVCFIKMCCVPAMSRVNLLKIWDTVDMCPLSIEKWVSIRITEQMCNCLLGNCISSKICFGTWNWVF